MSNIIMQMYKYICILQILFVEELYGWQVFHRGRHVGGNLGLPGGEHERGNVPIDDEWFTQTLDHFNPTDSRTWQQRYFTNDQYYDSTGGPVFLMIGGEGEASSVWMTMGSWIDYAQQFGALCFQLEHRYYGNSHPTIDLSTKNLQYLTSQQALADLATFIVAMNEKYALPSQTKWIVFGGSYAGSLAAWMRVKYPHLVHGAMSASSPLLAQVDFSDYYRVVGESLSTYSDDCVVAIKEGTSEIDVLLRDKIGQRNINQKFRLCNSIEESIDDPNDVANLYESLAGHFAGIVQYNKDNSGGPNISIDTLCNIMTNPELGPPVDRLAAVNSLILDVYNYGCLGYKHDKMIDALRNTSWDSAVAEGFRQWTYQTCTEFGFFQTSSYTPQVFGNNFPVSFFIQQCVDIFGPQYNSTFVYNAADRTNTIYGALDIDVTNVVFVHGSIDPWHPLGIIHTANQRATVIFIEGTAHCANMYPKSDKDMPQLNYARSLVAELIGTWIQM